MPKLWEKYIRLRSSFFSRNPSLSQGEIMKIYRVTEALQELSLTGQKPFVLIAPMNP